MHTLTAMFDTRVEAETARDRLSAAGVSNDHVTILDQNSLGVAGTHGSLGSTTANAEDAGGARHTSADRGRSLWQDLKALFSDDQSHYEEGLRRGGYLLTARVEDAEVDRAIDILDDEGSVDLDERTSTWRNEGWSDQRGERSAHAPGANTGSLAADLRAPLNGGSNTRMGDSPRSDDGVARDGLERDISNEAGETRIPVVEERLRVGKREVARGGVRVRSYIVEEPANESVRLREEHVTVDRRPVSGDALAKGDASDLLRERTIEVRETAEEAVIDKQTYVREEVVIGKTVDERVQEVAETVRRTQVDVEQLDDQVRSAARDSSDDGMKRR